MSDCTSGYERLRSGVIERIKTHDHSGLIVLLREGVAGWMVHAAPLPVVAQARSEETPAVHLTPEEIRSDVARVLASMVMARTDEAIGS